MPLNNPQPSIDQNSVAITGGTISGVTLSTSTSQLVNLGGGLTITSTGAIQTTGVGDGSVVGNARGTGAVDLQTSRTGASQVASGIGSFVVGIGNTASAAQSVAIGNGCNVSGATAVAIGNACSVSGSSGAAFGNSSSAASQAFAAGNGCQASGGQSVALGSLCNSSAGNAVSIGSSCTSSAAGATSFGSRATARIQGQFAFASGGISSASNTIGSLFVLQTETTNATVTEMLTLGSRITLQNDSTMAFSALISARRTDADNESAGYKIEGVIDRNTNAASTALVGTPTKTVLAEDTTAWDVNAIADTSNGALRFEVTGEAAKTIRWVAFVTVSEVVG